MSALDDLWEWDGAEGKWSLQRVSNAWIGAAHGLTYEPNRKVMFAHGGMGTTQIRNEWELGFDEGSTPVAVARFDFAPANSPPGSVVVSASVSAIAGGIGAEGLTGTTLALSLDGVDFSSLASNTASNTAPAALNWSSEDQALVGNLVSANKDVKIAVSPAINGWTQPAKLKVEWIELRLRYRQP